MAHELQVKGKMMTLKGAHDLPDNNKMATTPIKPKVLHEVETNTTPGLKKGLFTGLFLHKENGVGACRWFCKNFVIAAVIIKELNC